MKLGLRCLRIGILLIGLGGWIVHFMERGRAEPPAVPAPSGVELKSVKYKDLTEAVKGQRGKVVVVDIWGFF
jgi:hypothetical protein